MHTYTKYIVALFILMIGLHIIANLTGMYETRIIWIDKVLHLLAGIAIGLVWMTVTEKRYTNRIKISSLFLLLVLFVLLVSLFWEAIEFSFWRTLPFYAEKMNLYSPHLKDAITDIIANLFGVILLGWMMYLRKK